MKKLVSVFVLLLLILACTKNFDNIITDSFEFRFSADVDSTGYVLEELGTSFLIDPEKITGNTSFVFSYEQIDGSGYMVDSEGNRYDGNEIKIDSLNWDFGYVPESDGEHRILARAKDHDGKEKELELVYSVEYAPFTALLESAVNNFVVNKKNELVLIMLSENTSKELDSSYRVSYSVEGGLGSILKDSVRIEPGKTVDLARGSNELFYVPETLGEHVISMHCVAPDGSEQDVSLTLTVDNTSFFISTDVVGTGTVGRDLGINLTLETADVSRELEYEMVFYFADDSEGTGVLKDADGVPIQESAAVPLEVGTSSFNFSSEVIGKRKLIFDVSDSNNQIRTDSISFDYTGGNLGFGVSTPNSDYNLNQSIPVSFEFSRVEGSGYTLSYTNENGSGFLTDGDGNRIEPGTEVEIENDEFTYSYTPTSLGDNDVVFGLTDAEGVTELATLDLDIAGDSNSFRISSSSGNYELSDNADVTFDNGGSGDYAVTYTATGDGVFTYNGKVQEENVSFSVGPGISLASFQAIEAGPHRLEFKLVSSQGRETTSALDFDFKEDQEVIVSVGSNIGGRTPETGTGVDLVFEVDDQGEYTAVLTSSADGDFTYGGKEISPGESFVLENGESFGTYTGNESGDHGLVLEYVSSSGTQGTSTATVGYSGGTEDAGVGVSLTGTGDKITPGTPVTVVFEGIEGEGYGITYRNNGSGTFEYGGKVIPSGESFSPVDGVNGVYTPDGSGKNVITFDFESEDGEVTVVEETVTVDNGDGDGDTEGGDDGNDESDGDNGDEDSDGDGGTEGGDDGNENGDGDNGDEDGDGDGDTEDGDDGNENGDGDDDGSEDDGNGDQGGPGQGGPGQVQTFSAEVISDDTAIIRSSVGIILSVEGTGNYRASYQSEPNGVLELEGTEMLEGNAFNLDSDHTVVYFRSDDIGTYNIDFKVESDTGEIFEDSVTLEFVESESDAKFSVNRDGVRKLLNQGIKIEIKSEDNLVARIKSNEKFYLLYQGTYIGEGESFPLPEGETELIYVGTSVGVHGIEIEASPFPDFFESFSRKRRYIYGPAPDFDFTVEAGSSTVPVGQKTDLLIKLDHQIPNEEFFIMSYSSTYAGTFVYKGKEVEPKKGFLMDDGTSTGIYSSDIPGKHFLSFIIVSESGRIGYAETEVTFQ